MIKRDPGSFRDPSGFIFIKGGMVYRQISHLYRESYGMLMGSGLYETLVESRLMVPHKESDDSPADDEGFLVIRPKRVPFVSYPYEWCFGQYKQAAITTLRIHLLALEHGMVLKDASAYNIQFITGYAVLIDTLSFEPYKEGEPWIAYGQFCRHFLAPLMLMAKVDVRLSKLMMSHIDGVPLDLAQNILRNKSGAFGAGHIRMHSRAVARHGEGGKNDTAPSDKIINVSKRNIIAMAQSMLSYIEKLELKDIVTEWGGYYSNTNYSDISAKAKEIIVNEFLGQVEGCKNVWDFGANDGRYSRLAVDAGAHVVAFDLDHNAVERNYKEIQKNRKTMLPLILDLTAPSPAIGFANIERGSIPDRQKPDVIMMLAVIHHLAISNNLPFDQIAKWISGMCRYLIIEFVPKEDSQVRILLRTRVDIFPHYTKECFEIAFENYFDLLGEQVIRESGRSLYLYESIMSKGVVLEK